MTEARLAREADLPSLLALFSVSEVSPAVQPAERAQAIWAETLANPWSEVWVTEDEGRIAATCMLITAPNLLREGHGHAYLDNVVAHPDFRSRGHGRAVIEAALASAWAKNCFHVMMQSGRQDPAVHRFYRALGFIPGARTAYVAMNPAVEIPAAR